MPKPPTSAFETPSPHDEPDEAAGVTGLAIASMSAVEAAQYIAEFSAELSSIARRSNFDLLAYLLDMARLEAGRAVQAGKRSE